MEFDKAGDSSGPVVNASKKGNANYQQQKHALRVGSDYVFESTHALRVGTVYFFWHETLQHTCFGLPVRYLWLLGEVFQFQMTSNL